MATIPAGACSVSVAEVMDTQNSLALSWNSRSPDYTYCFLNGNWIIQSDGNYSEGRNIFLYTNGGTLQGRDEVRFSTQLTHAIDAFLIFQDENKGVIIKYLLPPFKNPKVDNDHSSPAPMAQNIAIASHERSPVEGYTNPKIGKTANDPATAPSLQMHRMYAMADDSRPSWLAELKKIMIQWKNRLEKLEIVMAQVENRLQIVENIIPQLQRRLQSVETTIPQLKNRLGTLETKVPQLENKLETLETKEYRAEQRLSKVEKKAAGKRVMKPFTILF